MAAENIENKECVCAFLEGLGDFKDPFLTLLDSIITILNTVKVAVSLWPEDPADRLRLLGLETQAAVIQTVIQPIQAPFALVQAYLNLYGDCPPIAKVGDSMSEARDMILGPFEERQHEIEQMTEELNLEESKIERLDNLINQLQDTKDAIEFCGQL
jgi:hypothetical protein